MFDTAFHATIPAAAATYAVPRRWREEWGVRRYGFHGLSVAWSAQRAPQVVGRPRSPLRQVVCHLGGGSSVTAVVDGRSVDTTMGFTPLEGVPMATRSGSVDPGALVAVLRRSGMDADALDHALNEESGMRGLAGGDGLMLELERQAAAGDAAAELAVDVFVHRLAGAVAAMAAAAGGIDVLVFTAGIGERSPHVRERVCARLAFLGVAIDADRNAAAAPDCDIARARRGRPRCGRPRARGARRRAGGPGRSRHSLADHGSRSSPKRHAGLSAVAVPRSAPMCDARRGNDSQPQKLITTSQKEVGA